MSMQVLKGVTHLHECGFMHRDLKAANILMSRHGIIKLCDFGVAKKVAAKEEDAVQYLHTPNVTTMLYRYLPFP